ncbi:MAG: TonB-dependent receptor plug domain-containing protein [Bacteroidota bacterium]|nr:TonB-dependent receptor plug domain-containing protein [Bacteroidota bacterium]
MKPILLCLTFVLLISLPCFSQDEPTDSSKTLNEVIVKAYEQNRRLVEVAAPVSFTGQVQLNRFGNMSILPALNITPGVSMEERSPGSYRLNIRGSSLRSPFGVRDVKIYLNEIPLTDPSGNTYLNQLSFYNFHSVEIIKGPASSLYGAGIGGAMLIHTLPVNWYKGVSLDYSAGSFAATNINVNVKTGDSDHENSFNYSHQNSDGYRSQAKMRRDIASWESLLKVSDRQSLHAYMSYSDLFYQTPGGLTLAQYNANPAQARPSAGAQPGAIQNKAAIYQKIFIAGFSDEYRFSENWQNTTSVYGSYTDFTNPGIRVYEIRKEPHFGGRSVFEYKKQIGDTRLQMNFGTEAQKGFFNTRDYGNKLGVADSLQSDNNINMWQYMIFAQMDLKLPGGWAVTGGVSMNKSSLEFINLSSRPSSTQKRIFENKLPPHLAILKKLAKDVSVYGSIARGFSTPTVSEMLRSDGLFGTNLQPEDGIDYEVGARGSLLRNKLSFDINVFFFDLKNTIVQRIDTSGVYYYVNAGSTKQNGVETYASYQLADNPQQFINSAKIWISYAWHDFHYGSFKQVNSDFSKKQLPGVAPQVIVAGLDISSKTGGYINITYNYTDPIALNDVNSDYASSYNLVSARLGYRKDFHRKIKAEIFAGADNLLDTKYSLGNDINAAAGRYYNAAPGRNYYVGLSLKWIKAAKN